jgi:hypothetical protein
MTEFLKIWLALMGDRRAVTSFDKGVIAAILGAAGVTEAALGVLSGH